MQGLRTGLLDPVYTIFEEPKVKSNNPSVCKGGVGFEKATKEFHRVAQVMHKWIGPLWVAPVCLISMHFFTKENDSINEQGEAVRVLKDRIIYNAKTSRYNRMVAASPVLYDNAHSAIASLQPGSLMSAFDEPDAFLGKFATWRHRFGVAVVAPGTDGEVWCMGYLPFGVKYGPRAQCLYSSEIASMVHRGELQKVIDADVGLRRDLTAAFLGDSTVPAPVPRVSVLMDDAVAPVAIQAVPRWM